MISLPDFANVKNKYFLSGDEKRYILFRYSIHARSLLEVFLYSLLLSLYLSLFFT